MTDYPELFDYPLPTNHIAHKPVTPRDHSRLMVLNRNSPQITHKHFHELPKLLTENDVLVLNDTKVFPARLIGRKENTTPAQLLLIRQLNSDTYTAIGKPNLKPGNTITFPNNLSATIVERDPQGVLTARFNKSQLKADQPLAENQSFSNLLSQIGTTPLPHYIHSPLSETKLRISYQTTFAKEEGSAAAPTAGLHFTKALIDKLKQSGVGIAYVTLHVGLGTFQNLRPSQLEKGELHQEQYSIDRQTADFLNQAKKQGKRIIAVGTTTTRVLETVSNQLGQLEMSKLAGETSIFIRPPYQFKFVDGLITNFHLPKTSLLMLVSAFVSHPNSTHQFRDFLHTLAGKAYRQAIEKKYRFFSFGDAMFIK